MYVSPCSRENLLKLLFGTIQFISLTGPRFTSDPTDDLNLI